MYTSYTKPNTKDIMVEKAIELFKERGTEPYGSGFYKGHL